MSTFLKTKRKEAGISQSVVANILGVSRPTYVKFENGVSKLTEKQKLILSQFFKGDINNAEVDSSEDILEVSVRKIPQENVKKFKETLLYILSKVGSRPNIGQTVLYKLLYFIDFDYYERFEDQLIGATYIKNTYGPTPISFAKIIKEMEKRGDIVEVKSKYFGHDQTKYIAVREADVSKFKGNELKHIDDELERLAHLTARQLSELSHSDTPWKVAKERDIINYEHVFYRPNDTSVREYEPL